MKSVIILNLPVVNMCCAVYTFICVFCAVAALAKETGKVEPDLEDRWIWGYFDDNEPNGKENINLPKSRGAILVSPETTPTVESTPTTKTPTTESIPTTTITASKTVTDIITTRKKSKTKPSYCEDSYEPPKKPNFSTTGRRINEAKCLEYVWQLNDRIREKDQNNECKKYRRRWWHGGGGHAVGGRKTKPGEFPHMGAVGWKAVVGTWVFKCGSSLISEKFVLTAAHCTSASPRDTTIADTVPKIVRLGDKHIIDRVSHNSPPKKDVNIARIIIHPKYQSPSKYFDIAVMELEEEVQFTRFIQPACLWNSLDTSSLGKEATLTGWGVIESGSLQISPELQAATVDVLESEECDELLKSSRNRNWEGFHNDQLCAGKLAGGVDSCQGDSGGPLQMKMPLAKDITDREGSMHYVIGIISFGVGCAHANLPGIYTRVSTYVDWIEDNVWANETDILKPLT